MTPLGWVLRARVRRAQALLESTTATIEEVATQTGFESAATLRAHFHRLVGVNPTTYRRTMGGRPRVATDNGVPSKSGKRVIGRR
jgi:transcriptional regulator GlxA family with amidase domain